MNWIFALSLAFAEPASETTDTGSTEPASETTDTGSTEPSSESTDTSIPEDTSSEEPSSEDTSEDTSTSSPTSEPSDDTSDTSADTAIIFESAADKADEQGGFGCSTIQFGGLALFWFAALLASFRRQG